MPTTQPGPAAALWSACGGPGAAAGDHAGRLPPAVSRHGRGPVRGGEPRLDGLVQKVGLEQPPAGAVSGRGQRASGAGGADGGDVRPLGGRDAAGAPRFDQPVPSGGYLWWYIDALSDDGRHGLTIIAFIGSVFSPYYRYQLWRGRGDAEHHVALNVALYGRDTPRWAMTERGRSSLARSASELLIGPSRVHWDGQALQVDIEEVCTPLPRRLHGRVSLHPHSLCRFVTPLDAAGRHRWGPIAPCARIEVELDRPGLRWRGHAYLDSNEGDEPVDRAFRAWDWSRATLRDGSTAVVYDLRPSVAISGAERLIAQRFDPDGSSQPFEPPPQRRLPRSLWGLVRTQRCDEGAPLHVQRTLEDTPFYVRSVLDGALLGEPVIAVHETLHVPRLVSLPVQLMLPFRMPRRG